MHQAFTLLTRSFQKKYGCLLLPFTRIVYTLPYAVPTSISSTYYYSTSQRNECTESRVDKLQWVQLHCSRYLLNHLPNKKLKRYVWLDPAQKRWFGFPVDRTVRDLTFVYSQKAVHTVSLREIVRQTQFFLLVHTYRYYKLNRPSRLRVGCC